MSVKSYFEVPIMDIIDVWGRAGMGGAPLPWQVPPRFNLKGRLPYDLREAVVVTAGYNAYNLTSYQEFSRIIYFQGQLRLYHTDHKSEPILLIFGAEPLTYIVDGVPIEREGNILPFKKPQ